MGLLWLTGMNYPDHTTLWRYWNDNRAAIRTLFKQLLQIALSANLVGMVLHAVDGTKVLSQASERRGWHRKALQKKLKKLDEAIFKLPHFSRKILCLSALFVLES
jgi:DNA-binding protein Fis